MFTLEIFSKLVFTHGIVVNVHNYTLTNADHRMRATHKLPPKFHSQLKECDSYRPNGHYQLPIWSRSNAMRTRSIQEYYEFTKFIEKGVTTNGSALGLCVCCATAVESDHFLLLMRQLVINTSNGPHSFCFCNNLMRMNKQPTTKCILSLPIA